VEEVSKQKQVNTQLGMENIMNVGGDFFRILSFAIAIMRLWGKLFGSDEDKAAVIASEQRTDNDTTDEAC